MTDMIPQMMINGAEVTCGIRRAIEFDMFDSENVPQNHLQM